MSTKQMVKAHQFVDFRPQAFQELARAQRFNVKCAVVDAEPEVRKSWEWEGSERFPISLCDYAPSFTMSEFWDDRAKIVKVNRTESLDSMHHLKSSGLITIPRRCDEVEEFVRELCCLAKVSEEDQETGTNGARGVLPRSDVDLRWCLTDG